MAFNHPGPPRSRRRAKPRRERSLKCGKSTQIGPDARCRIPNTWLFSPLARRPSPTPPRKPMRGSQGSFRHETRRLDRHSCLGAHFRSADDLCGPCVDPLLGRAALVMILFFIVAGVMLREYATAVAGARWLLWHKGFSKRATWTIMRICNSARRAAGINSGPTTPRRFMASSRGRLVSRASPSARRPAAERKP